MSPDIQWGGSYFLSWLQMFSWLEPPCFYWLSPMLCIRVTLSQISIAHFASVDAIPYFNGNEPSQCRWVQALMSALFCETIAIDPSPIFLGRILISCWLNHGKTCLFIQPPFLSMETP